MSSQSISGGESIFREQPRNLRQEKRILDSSHQYLQPIESIKDWNLIMSGGIHQLFYHANHQHWEAYRFSDALDRSIRSLTILTIYGDRGSITYRWYRPHIDAVVTERNFDLLNNFISQDLSLSTQLLCVCKASPVENRSLIVSHLT
jgi:hypothetical protein